MRRIAISLFALMTVVAFSGLAEARGGKPGGAFCRTSRACESGSCVFANPDDRFGTCCTPNTCPGLGAQCGLAGNGCGGELFCGDCDSSSTCENNQCVPIPTTTSTTTTSTTTTTTTTTPTTTLCPNGIPTCNTNNSPCQEPSFCFILQTAENPCGECIDNFPFCMDLQPCTQSSECQANEVCVVQSCCEGTGVCSPRCGTRE